MRIAIAADHGGFPHKARVVEIVRTGGHEALDLGAHTLDPADDYPDFAEAVGRAIQDGRAERAILLCGSGVGACIAANKLDGVRASVCHDVYSAHQGVEHDDMNVLCLGARIIGPALLDDLVEAFLSAELAEGERFQRRLDKVAALEQSR